MKNYIRVVTAGKLKFIPGFILAATLSLAPMPAVSGLICGPGTNWVNNCAPGQDSFLGTFNFSFEWLAANLGPLVTGEIYHLNLYGPTTVTRSAPVGPAGVGQQINTEIIYAQGEQLHPTLGALSLRIGTGNGVSTLTTGEVEQNSSLNADSFFDVFFEFDSAWPTPFYNTNNDPLHLTSILTCLPPGETNPSTGQNCAGNYLADPSSLPQIWGNLGSGDQVVAQVVLSNGAPPHHDVPEPTSFILIGLGLAGLGLSRRKRAV